MKKTNKHRLSRKAYRQITKQKKAPSKVTVLELSSATTGISKEVIVYQSELDYISQCILDYPNIETGGQLFGFYTPKGAPVVCYALGPGPHANHQITFFNQDLNYLQTIGDILTHEYGLQHIGEWHSHHQLQLDHPSGHDAQTLHHSIDALHLGQFLLCIGTVQQQAATVNAFAFYENDISYYAAKWCIKAIPSPFRQAIDEHLNNLLVHPVTSTPCLTGMKISHISVGKDADVNYLLRAYNNNLQSL